MRIKILIGSALVLAVILVLLHFPTKHHDPVVIKFLGYTDYKQPYKPGGGWLFVKDKHLFTNSVQAFFVFSNCTDFSGRMAADWARIQIKTTNGWTDYAGSNFWNLNENIPVFDRIGSKPFLAHGSINIFRAFPREAIPWRLHVSYTLSAPSGTFSHAHALRLEASSQEIE